MTEDEYQNLAATYLTRLMKRDAEEWHRRMYFDHAASPAMISPSSITAASGSFVRRARMMMQKDRQFRVSGEWALASDGVQWMLQIMRGNSWRPIKFIRSTKAHLADRMREKGVPPEDMHILLDGLPDTFDAWLAEQRLSRASHDDFEGEADPRTLETVE